MKVLVACEFSGTVRDAFSAKGHDAWSCDLLPSEKPGNHIQGDALEILDQGWDLMIAHPPCTHLAVSGASWFEEKRKDGRQQSGVDFFLELARCNITRWAIENPIGIMSSLYREPDQIIQPYEYGHEAQKSTCLWLKNIPLLKPTNVVSKGEMVTFPSGKTMPKWYADSYGDWALRSKTFQGIADAMADQWGNAELFPIQETLL